MSIRSSIFRSSVFRTTGVAGRRTEAFRASARRARATQLAHLTLQVGDSPFQIRNPAIITATVAIITATVAIRSARTVFTAAVIGTTLGRAAESGPATFGALKICEPISLGIVLVGCGCSLAASVLLGN
jgi:hypothetical protein